MPSIYTPTVFLREFSDVYKTLDLRVAAVQHGGQWDLVAASAHLRIIPSEAATQDFQSLAEQFGLIDSPVFRIVQHCLPIAEAQQFFDTLTGGELIVNGAFRIKLSQPHDVLSIAGHARLDYQNPKRWPSIEVRREISKNENVTRLLLNDPTVLRDAELAGYEYPYVAVGKLLDIDYSQSSDAGWIWVECDIPVRLLQPIAARHGDELKLTLRAESDPSIQDVACTVRRTRSGGPVVQQSVVQLTVIDGERGEFVPWTGELRTRLEQADQLTLEALSRQVGRLYSIRVKPLDLLPREQANPLLVALEAFCPAEQIRLLLEEPQKAQFELPNKNPAKLFEVSVQWLLTTLGWRAIWLHSYERIKNANVEIGAVDCLAYREDENVLLLVNCSLAAPDPGELHRQENLTTWLRKQLFSDSRIVVCSALFSASHRPEITQKQAYGSGVRVLFKEDVDELLQAARAGRKLDYSKYSSPTPWYQ
jgi:hypothetical protein